MVTSIEGKNRIIAEFMDFVKSGFNGELIFNTETREEFTIDELKFHTSWDWLVPVMAKVYAESANLSDTRKFRLSHILLSYHTAVTENNIEFAQKHVFDAVQLINEE